MVEVSICIKFTPDVGVATRRRSNVLIRDHRAEFPVDVKEHRVVTYESSRGLEGWIVACLDADAFFDYKLMSPYLSPTGVGVPGDLGVGQPRSGIAAHRT